MLNLTWMRLVLVVLIILIAYGVYAYFRPVPPATPVSEVVSVPKSAAIGLPWPASGQAAIGANGYGVLASHNTAQPVPIASIAKVITAMAVLKQKPITPGSQGATITLGQSDVDLFNYYFAKDGSVANVSVGEQITQLQALQIMLIPSANNMADSLANWAFGSVSAYVNYANQMVKKLGLTHTSIGDASGFGDTTMSTADDLVKLGIAAAADPSLAQVVSQTQVQVPVQGAINNLNLLLGQDGVVGIKTGNTDKAGGCYLFAAQRAISGHKITLVGAILSQPTLSAALNAARPLIRASDAGFYEHTYVHKGQTMGYYQTAWHSIAQFQAAKDLSLFAWQGQTINIQNEPKDLPAAVSAGSLIGSVTVKSGGQSNSTGLVLSQDLASAPWTWRLLH